MKNLFLSLALVALIAVTTHVVNANVDDVTATTTALQASACSTQGWLDNNALLYPTQNYTVDPNQLVVNVTGTVFNGEIAVHIRNPNTVCVNDPNAPVNPVCGLQANDVVFRISNVLGKLNISSFVNTNVPTNLGKVTSANVQGAWTLNDNVFFTINFFLDIYYGNPVPVSKVMLRLDFAGKITSPFVAPTSYRSVSGKVSMLASAYIVSSAYPYQFVTAFDNFQGPGGNHIIRPSRAISAYSSTGSTSSPAGIPIRGTLKNFACNESSGLCTALASISTPVLGLTGSLNVVDVNMTIIPEKFNPLLPSIIDDGCLQISSASFSYNSVRYQLAATRFCNICN